MSEENEKDVTPSTEGNESEVVKANENRVEVSADLLNDAVMQLRKMAEIRQRDSERQERAISQMQNTLKRGRILSRYVIFSCLVVMLISIGLAYLMWQSATSEKTTAAELENVSERLETTSRTIAEETQKQVSSLDQVRVDVVKAREDQVRIAANLEQELKATREVQASVVDKVDEQLGAVRAERDQVTSEVRNLLEEKTQFYISKEQELKQEREAIKEAKDRSKEEQKELINDTIARLNAMAASLEPADAAPISDADIDEVVNTVEEAAAVEETMDAEDTTDQTEEEVIEEAAPAEEAPAEETAEVPAEAAN